MTLRMKPSYLLKCVLYFSSFILKLLLAKRRMKLIKLLEDPKRARDLKKTGKLKAVNLEILKCYDQQLTHFKNVALVMEKIDYPSSFWQDALKKLTDESSAAQHLYV